MIKKIDLELTHEWLNTKPSENEDKKIIAAEKKKLKELKEKYPIQIEVAFKIPWWAPKDEF